MVLELSIVKQVLSMCSTEPELVILDLIMEENVIKTSSPPSENY